MHVSTAYVNINKPPGTTVHERIYPLMNGEVEVDGESVARVGGCAMSGKHHLSAAVALASGQMRCSQHVYGCGTSQATGSPSVTLDQHCIKSMTNVAGFHIKQSPCLWKHAMQ